MAIRRRIDKVCEGCGVLMTNVPPERKYCYDCVKKRNREYQREYQRQYSEVKREKRNEKGEKPQKRSVNPNQKYCEGCVYWGGCFKSNYCCNYIFIEGHSRPCPPGKGCTEKIVGKRKRTMDFGEERW